MNKEKQPARDGHRPIDQRAEKPAQDSGVEAPEAGEREPKGEAPDVHGEVAHGEEWEREDGW